MGSISVSRLVSGPSGVLAMNEPPQPPQCCGCHWMAHPAAVFESTAVESAVAAIFDAPVGTGKLQHFCSIGTLWAQARHDPHHFGLGIGVVQVTRALQPRQLLGMRKTQLCRFNGTDSDGALFTASSVVVDFHMLRGEGTPAAEIGLGVEGPVDCL